MESIVSQDRLPIGREHELLISLEAAGLGPEEAQAVIESRNNILATKVVNFIRQHGFEPTTPQRIARHIMGRENFLGVEHAIECFGGVNLTKKQLLKLAEVPYSEATLEQYKDSHVLVAVPPISILDMEKSEGKYPFAWRTDDWYKNQPFAKKRGQVGWHLIRKGLVSDSVGKPWSQQKKLLGENEEIPEARVILYTDIGLQSLAESFFFGELAYCADTASSKNGVFQIFIGYFGLEQLRIDGTKHKEMEWEGVGKLTPSAFIPHRVPGRIGLFSAIKPNQ
ncbi:MAG TPA: hypothetical protein ENI16_00540 [Candidatus Portnoybacteria bacterium]|nr:hypothetical protein [Candidatus Portnoybacteria bacterium]